MDYKEEYKRALSMAKMWCRNTAMPDNVKEIFSKIFPELKESEDERIRKWLIDTIKAVPNDSIEWEKIDKSDILAWLEKQGEQKTDECE
jgi:hypothetical protein